MTWQSKSAAIAIAIMAMSLHSNSVQAMPEQGKVVAGEGRTRIFLYPPRRPRVVDGLLTNFHLPQSTLLMLVCTFCEHDKVMAAYREAVARRLRFFSYGDCMLLLPEDGEAAR